jgi:hypothetical protein
MEVKILKCKHSEDCDKGICQFKLKTNLNSEVFKSSLCPKTKKKIETILVSKIEVFGERAFDRDDLSPGDIVKLLPGFYNPIESNPAIDSPFECEGLVRTVTRGGVHVTWENGTRNGYLHNHLIKVEVHCKSIWN